MISWIADNLSTLLVGAATLVVIGLAVRAMIRNKKSGRSLCGTDCSGCPMSQDCDKKRI